MKTSRKITVKAKKAIKAVKSISFSKRFVSAINRDVNDFNERELMYTQ